MRFFSEIVPLSRCVFIEGWKVPVEDLCLVLTVLMLRRGGAVGIFCQQYMCVLWSAEKFQEIVWKNELKWILGLLRTALRIFS